MKRPPPRPTSTWVAAIAQRYLEQRGASVASFRRWLQRRVATSVKHHGADASEAARWVEDAVSRALAAGWLNDEAFAASRAASLRRRGQSSAGVRAKLREKGIAPALVEAVAPRSDADDLEAARKYARTHRLGPWSRDPSDTEARAKDLARLGRRGFSFAVARAALAPLDPSE